MNLTNAEVVNNQQILGELERRPRYGVRSVSGSWLIWLNCPQIAREARPGQFIMVKCGDDCLLRRPFSIHQVKGDDIALFFAVWEDGKGTKWLSEQKPGSMVDLLGPLGNGFEINTKSRHLLLVAGGVGIAPLCFLAQKASNQGCSVRLLRGASGEYKPSGKPNPDQHYPQELLPAGIEQEAISTSPDGMKHMVTDLIHKHIGWADQVFACGPEPMYRDMARRRKELLSSKPVQISMETRMGCGFGVCYGCTVKTKHGLKQVCQDGPVFDLDDILWKEQGNVLTGVHHDSHQKNQPPD